MNKKKLKQNKLIVGLYRLLRRGLTRVSPTAASKLIYKVSTGMPLDLDNPKTFDQKIMWLKLNTYYNNPLITQCADKYAVREYVKECGCEESLNELIGVYDKSSEIDWDSLPKAFALKCNHGCGYNIICDDKSKFDINGSIKLLDKWMKEDYFLDYAEVNYKFVKKKIICEKYLKTEDGFLPNDYKIYCFNGEPKIVLVCFDRESDLQLVFMDMDWNVTKIGIDEYYDGRPVKKPESLNQMLEYCRKLSKGLPFVRMDFYDVNGKAVFGEMTFTPSGGINKAYSDYGQQYLCELLEPYR